MKLLLSLGTLALINATSVMAAEHTVNQKGKEFSVETIDIAVGDSINFTNEDPFAHNVFSVSDVKQFDLGSYPQGQSKKVTFDKPGKVEVECSIHPNMQLLVNVK